MLFVSSKVNACISSKVNACISEFDLLLSTYSKWLYNDKFRPYLVYIIWLISI